MKLWGMLAAALLLAGCAGRSVERDSLAEIASDYVQMQLEIGEREPGYIDAYYGPAEWQAAAKAAPRSIEKLSEEAATLKARLDAVEPETLDRWEQRRRAFLIAQLTAAQTRLRMLRGETLSFEEEAEGLFGVRPELKPLSTYDPILARIERLVPGKGALADRVDAFQNLFSIPADKVRPVMDAAIAECRRRSLAHIPMPAGERFTLELVKDKSWSGYNYYQGNAHSLIQINTDLPIRIDRAIDLGCHEGYPGHHALNTLLEQKLTKERGWVEFSVYPLYSPQSLIAEGTANYGADLAFPDDERLAFETGTLYPLAGLPTARAAEYLALQQAMKDLSGARFTIAADYLAKRTDQAEAVRLLRKYQLVSRERAEQSLRFIDNYRSYIINYGLGEEMSRRWVEAQGPDAATRWKALERLISEPTLPSDLAVAP